MSSLLPALIHLLTRECFELSLCRTYHILRHFKLVIRGDEEFNILVKVTMAGGGVLPSVHKFLNVNGVKKIQGASAYMSPTII